MIQAHKIIGFITYYGKEHNPFRDAIRLSSGCNICDQVTWCTSTVITTGERCSAQRSQCSSAVPFSNNGRKLEFS